MTQRAAVLPFRRLRHAWVPGLCRSLRLLIGALCLSIAQPLAGLAQTSAPTPLPPAAQEALNKGLIAAKVPDYLLAIRYFEEARKLAPAAPITYLNLGLAESRIPGRELRAMAWFGTYLAAYPTAPNAAAVKEQIAVLDVKNESNVASFIRTVQAAANSMSGAKKQDALGRVALLWAKLGDLETALHTANLRDVDMGFRAAAYASVAAVQAMDGDLAGARKTADMISQMTDANNELYRGQAYADIAKAQARAGDLAGARTTLKFVVESSELIPEGARGQFLWEVVKAQAEAGDLASARTTVELIPSATYKKIAREHVVALAPAGTETRQSAKPPEVGISDWLYSLLENDRSSVIGTSGDLPPLKYKLFVDVAGHLKSLKSTRPPMLNYSGVQFKEDDEDQKSFDDLRRMAEDLISAQSMVGWALKAQASK